MLKISSVVVALGIVAAACIGGATDRGGGQTSAGVAVDGGLTVDQALASDVTDVVAVQGFFFDDGSGPRLCELLAESYPPLCGGSSLPIVGLDASPGGSVSAQGIVWTDQPVTLFGTIVEGALVLQATTKG